MAKNKKFQYGIGKMMLNDFEVGYIEKDSFDYGGQKGESVDVNAEQVPSAPVLVLQQSNGTIKPTFNVIQVDYKNLVQLMGGSLVGPADNPTGWNAPGTMVTVEGHVQIDLVSGQSVLIPQAKVKANLGGKLSLTETSKIEVELGVEQPSEGLPYGTHDTDALPASWKSDHLLKEEVNTSGTESAG